MRFVRDMNPLLRGLIVIALIAGVIVVLQLQATLTALFLIAQIAFFLAIAFFIFLMWRERRGDIEGWSRRSRIVFYGAALLIVADIASLFVVSLAGLDALVFFAVLALAGFSMYRVWRDEHTFSA
jgi:small-conductance mechanosensitive channel